MLAGMVWMVSIALIPAAVGKGVDEGIVPGDLGGPGPLVAGPARARGVAASTAAARHYFAVHNWLYASYRGAQLTAAGRRAGRAGADPRPCPRARSSRSSPTT